MGPHRMAGQVDSWYEAAEGYQESTSGRLRAVQSEPKDPVGRPDGSIGGFVRAPAVHQWDM